MTAIDVDVLGDEGDPRRFRVAVRDAGSATTHDVTASLEDLARLGGGYASPEGFIRSCFEFLLAREAKEQTLGSFDVRVIGRYFPEFEREILRGTAGA